MKAKDILQILQEHREEVKNKYKAEIKGIFGSFARAEQTSQSDLDILVDFHSDADLFDFVGLSLFLEEKLHCKVDIVPRNSLREEIKEEVLREAVYI